MGATTWCSAVVVTSALLLAACERAGADGDGRPPEGSPVTGVAAPDRPDRTTTGRGGAAEPAPAAAREGKPPRGQPARPRAESRLQGSNGWRMQRPADHGEIAGYTTRTSAAPGTRLGLKVSTTARTWTATAYRIGAYRGGTGRAVWRSGPQPGSDQPGARFEPHETRTMVAPWRTSLTLDTAGWEPGLYVFRLTTASGWDAQIPYVVTSPSTRGTVALVAPVTTWQAYNVWGGYSLYAGPSGDQRSWAVSFRRPYFGVGGMNDFRTAVVPIVVLAEGSGQPLSYLTSLELHRDPEALEGARGMVSMGHDEYWTTDMRRHVLAARDAGTNLAFLGANTMYWRVRYDERTRVMTGYRSDAHLDPVRTTDPRNATSRYRDAPAALPENDLVGMLYECYPVDTDYRVVSPGWWGFAGTGVRHGSSIEGLVGGESDRVYPNARTPRPMQVLSHNWFSCRGAPTTTQSVYYTVPSGAGVFTAGTLRWGCALADHCDRALPDRTRSFARKVTENLLRGYAEGPVGRRHPARDNLEAFDLPLLNSVEAS